MKISVVDISLLLVHAFEIHVGRHLEMIRAWIWTRDCSQTPTCEPKTNEKLCNYLSGHGPSEPNYT